MHRAIQAVEIGLGVKVGEGRLFLLLLLANMLIGVGRSFAWTAGNALFLDRFGSEGQPYLFLITSLLLPALAASYLRLEQRLSFRSLTIGSFLAVFTLLVGLRMLLRSSDAGWITYMAAVSIDLTDFLTGMAFWALAGMLCDVRQAKRLFPLVGSGEWIVMVGGGFATPWLVGLIGTVNLYWLAASGIGGGLVVVLLALRQVPKSDDAKASDEPEPQAKSANSSLLKNPFVLFLLVNNALSTVGLYFLDNAFCGFVEKRYPDADQLAGFLGQFWAWVAVVILVSRGFFTSRLLSRYGVNLGLSALPVSVFVSIVVFGALCGAIGIDGALPFWVLVMARFFDACLRNDLDESAGLILYQPLPLAQRSLAQATNEGVFLPVATGISGGLLLLMKNVFGFGPLEITLTIPVVVIAWILSGFEVTRRYPGMVAAAIAGHRFDAATLSLTDNTSLNLLKTKLQSNYATEVLYALALLENADPEFLRAKLTHLLDHSDPDVRREVLRILARREMRDAVPAVRERVRAEMIPQVRGEVLRTLAKLEEGDALDELTPFLKDEDPELRVSAIVGLMRHVGLDGIVLAADQFDAMRNSHEPSQRRLAARVLGEVGIQNFYRPLVPLLRDEQIEVRNEALIAAGKLKIPRLWPDVLAALDIPGLQSAAVSSLVAGGEAVLPLLETEFEQRTQDPEFQVRVIGVFQQIRGDEVLAFLERHIDDTHSDVYSRVLSALSLCRYHVSASDVARVVGKIQEESQHAAWLLSVSTSLFEGEAFSLLKDALDDLQQQDLDRIYLLLSFIYDAHAMFDSHSNLEHPSAERRAYAFEIIDSMISRDLKPVPIFAEAPDHVLAQVVPILEEQEFEAGQRIFEKGDLGTSMYVIVSGKLRVHIDDRELTVLGERQVFGELALLDPEPRSASITAIESTLVFKISQAEIYELMADHIEITRGIMRVLCRRIRQK